MNTEEQSITKTNTEEKVKNPKRVAQGKKLAEISKAAKARKRAEQQNEETSDFSQLPNLTTSISLIGVVTGVIGTYIAWKNLKQEQVNTSEPTSPLSPNKAGRSETKDDPQVTVSKPKPKPTEVKYNNLDDEDI